MHCKPFSADIILYLTESECLQLASASIKLAQYDISDPRLYRHEDFQAHADRLEGPNIERIRLFAQSGNSYGTLLLWKLPLDPFLPGTPNDGCRPSKKLSVSEAVTALIGCLLGDIFSYADEKEGLLIQNICPVRGQEEKQENTGSKFLEFHTEDSFHPIPPDLLMLTCLRGDRTGQALTATASLVRVIDRLDEESLKVLTEPEYTIHSSPSFGMSRYRKKVPIIEDPKNARGLVFDPYATEAGTLAAARALERLKEELEKETFGACLVPGEAIIIDNTVACHARTDFEPFYDGEDRWLQRAFFSRRFEDMSMLLYPGTRMVDPAQAREHLT